MSGPATSTGLAPPGSRQKRPRQHEYIVGGASAVPDSAKRAKIDNSGQCIDHNDSRMLSTGRKRTAFFNLPLEIRRIIYNDILPHKEITEPRTCRRDEEDCVLHSSLPTHD
jgi:hypothetical protein